MTALIPGSFGNMILLQESGLKKSDFGGAARSFAIGFSIGNKGYIGTGAHGYTGPLYKDFWAYDPSTNSWTQKADFGGGITSRAVGFSLGNKGYVGTGQDTLGLTSNFWEYDPATDMWVQKASFPGNPRMNATGFSIGTKGYLGFGLDNSAMFVSDFWQYDPISDAWQVKTSIPNGGRYMAYGCSVGYKGYIAGGETSNLRYDIWEYNSLTNVWTQKNSILKDGGDGPGAFTIGSHCFFVMGGPGGAISEYAPDIDDWIISGGPRYGGFGLSIGSKCYIGGGLYYLNDFWECDANTNIWTQKARLPLLNSNIGGVEIAGRVSFTIDSMIYLCGGNNHQFWQYKPDSNFWVRRADFPGHAVEATGFSIDSIGYVGTGRDSLGNCVQDFWAYNPRINTWSRKADFVGIARGSATGLTIGHYGYIGTGDTSRIFSSKGGLNDFWQYDPVNDSWMRKSDFGGRPRFSAVGFSLFNEGFIGTGLFVYDSLFNPYDRFYSDFWKYDPLANQWAEITSFTGTPRFGAVGFSNGHSAFVGTGCDNTFTAKNDFWQLGQPICFSISQTLCLVSIDTSTRKPIIIWEKANKYATDSFHVYRSLTPDTVYALVGSIGRDSLSAWEDISANPDSFSYRYKIALLDTCGNTGAMSPYHQTIHLTQLGGGIFSWTPYRIENDTAHIGSYAFYKDSTCHGDWYLVATVPDSVTTASDPSYGVYPCSDYKVVLTLANPCNPTRSVTTISSNVYTVLPNSINEIASQHIRVSPNPANSYLTISCSGSRASNGIINITNALGQSVYNAQMNGDSQTISTEGWQGGVYFVTVSSGTAKTTVKVLKW